MGCAPALIGNEMVQDRRPDRAAEIIAGRDDGDGDSAPAREPARGVRDQRPEGGGGAEPDHEVHERERHEARSKAGHDVAETERARAAHDRRRNAEPVGQAPEHDAAACEAEHGQRERQRRVRAGNAEFGLHRRQHHRHRPHADAADGAEHHGDAEPPPGEGRFGPGVESPGLEHLACSRDPAGCFLVVFDPLLIERPSLPTGRTARNSNPAPTRRMPAWLPRIATMAPGGLSRRRPGVLRFPAARRGHRSAPHRTQRRIASTPGGTPLMTQKTTGDRAFQLSLSGQRAPVDYERAPTYSGLIAEKDVLVPMRDGVKIAVDIYRPDTADKLPALLALSIHNKDL